MGRILSWFSCGAASAVAAKLALKKYGDKCEVLYCNTFAYEHEDNKRFFVDVENWLGVKIKILSSAEYIDIYDVFDKTGWLVGPAGARCTIELKKELRIEYQRPGDIHIFGFTADEEKRAREHEHNNFDIISEFPLINNVIDKRRCYQIIKNANIELPMMYKLGYKNNNCRGCVKGGAGYWNKIRIDFPDIFEKMSITERKLKVAINKRYENNVRIPIFLDELPPDMGNMQNEPDMECGVLCVQTQEEASMEFFRTHIKRKT